MVRRAVFPRGARRGKVSEERSLAVRTAVAFRPALLPVVLLLLLLEGEPLSVLPSEKSVGPVPPVAVGSSSNTPIITARSTIPPSPSAPPEAAVPPPLPVPLTTSTPPPLLPPPFPAPDTPSRAANKDMPASPESEVTLVVSLPPPLPMASPRAPPNSPPMPALLLLLSELEELLVLLELDVLLLVLRRGTKCIVCWSHKPFTSRTRGVFLRAVVVVAT
mmetsp:Transcript_3745/g.7256  ORF Transcript_3745/g.7256 Transcript_3745/m.7256 type:complete len:219 (-) Transcript_3745:7-663(-)